MANKERIKRLKRSGYVQISLEIPEKLLDRIKEKAWLEDRSMSSYVRWVLGELVRDDR